MAEPRKLPAGAITSDSPLWHVGTQAQARGPAPVGVMPKVPKKKPPIRQVIRNDAGVIVGHMGSTDRVYRSTKAGKYPLERLKAIQRWHNHEDNRVAWWAKRWDLIVDMRAAWMEWDDIAEITGLDRRYMLNQFSKMKLTPKVYVRRKAIYGLGKHAKLPELRGNVIRDTSRKLSTPELVNLHGGPYLPDIACGG